MYQIALGKKLKLLCLFCEDTLHALQFAIFAQIELGLSQPPCAWMKVMHYISRKEHPCLDKHTPSFSKTPAQRFEAMHKKISGFEQ